MINKITNKIKDFMKQHGLVITITVLVLAVIVTIALI